MLVGGVLALFWPSNGFDRLGAGAGAIVGAGVGGWARTGAGAGAAVAG
jgi:hypothetical protein